MDAVTANSLFSYFYWGNTAIGVSAWVPAEFRPCWYGSADGGIGLGAELEAK